MEKKLRTVCVCIKHVWTEAEKQRQQVCQETVDVPAARLRLVRFDKGFVRIIIVEVFEKDIWLVGEAWNSRNQLMARPLIRLA